jgi:hypothetical protein
LDCAHKEKRVDGNWRFDGACIFYVPTDNWVTTTKICSVNDVEPYHTDRDNGRAVEPKMVSKATVGVLTAAETSIRQEKLGKSRRRHVRWLRRLVVAVAVENRFCVWFTDERNKSAQTHTKIRVALFGRACSSRSERSDTF